MPDSSWQHLVLRDLGVARRGLVTTGPVPPIRVPAGWSTGPAQQPAPPPGLPETPAPTPSAHVAPEAMTPAPAPAPVAPEPVAPEPVAPGPDASGAEADESQPYDPFPDPPKQAPAEAEEAQPYDPFPDPPKPAPAEAEEPQSYDPFPDPPQPAAPEPEPAQAAHDTAAPPEQQVPLVNEEFSWEAAISPVGASAPQAPGLPQAPGVEEQESAGSDDAAAPSQASAAPAWPSPTAPQQHGAGAVPAADEFVRKNQHGDALVRRMGRGVRKAVGASGQIRTQTEISEYLRRPVSGFRQLAVVSVRGGAGKTTVAALLATELARHRPDRVLAMDADAELGSLPLRLGVRSELSLFDLAAQQPRTFEEAARFMQQTREGLWVLAATRGGRITGEFDFDTFQSAFSAVSRYISTAVTDCSAGILTDLHRGILGQSHSVVLVTPGTVDGALSARGALEWFSGGGQQRLLPRTVIAMVSHAPQIGADLNRATQMLTAWGTPVVHVPYDRHIATGSAVDMSRLGEGTQAAVSRIAYEAFARSLGDLAPGH